MPAEQVVVTAKGRERELEIRRGVTAGHLRAVLGELPDDAIVIDGYALDDPERPPVAVVFRLESSP